MKMKRRIKTKVLIIVLLILFEMLGLVARINNDLITILYVISEVLIMNTLRKRYGVRVR